MSESKTFMKEVKALFEKSQYKGKLTWEEYLTLSKSFLEKNPSGSVKEFKDHIEKHLKLNISKSVYKVETERLEEIVSSMINDQLGLIRKRREDAIEVINPELFTKRLTPEQKEAKRKKEAWEQGTWILEHQKQYIAQGGRSKSVPITGARNSIEPFEGDIRKLPKLNAAKALTTRTPDPTYTDGEKATFIRDMSRDLRETPFHKWTINQMEFARMFPDIADSIRRYQDSKKKR